MPSAVLRSITAPLDALPLIVRLLVIAGRPTGPLALVFTVVRLYVPVRSIVLLVCPLELAVLMAVTRSATDPLLTVNVARSWRSSSFSRNGRNRAWAERRRSTVFRNKKRPRRFSMVISGSSMALLQTSRDWTNGLCPSTRPREEPRGQAHGRYPGPAPARDAVGFGHSLVSKPRTDFSDSFPRSASSSRAEPRRR